MQSLRDWKRKKWARKRKFWRGWVRVCAGYELETRVARCEFATFVCKEFQMEHGTRVITCEGNSRLCPFCSMRKAREQSAMMLRVIERREIPMGRLRFVTLTLPSRVPFGELRFALRMMRGSLGKLRRREVFADVLGHRYKLEVVPHLDGWHLHVHLLCEMRQDGFLDNRNRAGRPLETAWGEIVGTGIGGRVVVDVKAVGSGRKRQSLRTAVNEITKYTAKLALSEGDGRELERESAGGRPLRIEELPRGAVEDLLEWLEGGGHTCEMLGEWRHAGSEEQHQEDEGGSQGLQCKECGGSMEKFGTIRPDNPHVYLDSDGDPCYKFAYENLEAFGCRAPPEHVAWENGRRRAG